MIMFLYYSYRLRYFGNEYCNAYIYQATLIYVQFSSSVGSGRITKNSPSEELNLSIEELLNQKACSSTYNGTYSELIDTCIHSLKFKIV